MNVWKKIITTVVLCAVPVLIHGADYALWNDETYDFTKARTIYVDEMNTATAGIHSPAREQLIKNDFAKKASELKWKMTKFIVPPPAVPTATKEPVLPADTTLQQPSVERKNVTTADPGADVTTTAPMATPPLPGPGITDTASLAKADTVIVPQAAKEADADLYVAAQVLAYGIGTGLIPAHTEWNTYQVQDVYYDRDGHAHWFTRNISYPVYVPDRYVPVASVGVRFTVVDVKTGAVVSLSEDTRDRGSSDDTRGVYNRIIDRFFKNLKKEVEP